MIYSCDGCGQRVDVGASDPQLILCKNCNGGQPAWNCTLTGSHACDCVVCDPAAARRAVRRRQRIWTMRRIDAGIFYGKYTGKRLERAKHLSQWLLSLI